MPRAGAGAAVADRLAALELVYELDLHTYPLFPAARADLLRRLGGVAAARVALEAALPLADSDADRALLADRLRALANGSIDEG